MAIFKKTQFLFFILFFSNAFSSKILQANFMPSNDSRLGLICVVSWSAWVGYRLIDNSINKKLDFNSFDNFPLPKKQPNSFANHTSLEERLARRRAEGKEIEKQNKRFWFF
jgi:hypothetical protein